MVEEGSRELGELLHEHNYVFLIKGNNLFQSLHPQLPGEE